MLTPLTRCAEHRTRRGLIAATLAAALLAGCAVGPQHRVPDTALPTGWASAPAAEVADGPALELDWWRRFDDPLLAQLVERALAANTDLRIAQARLRSARAARAIAGAELAPTVGASVAASTSRSGSAASADNYGVGFDARWEIDLFGGLRRNRVAAVADEQSSAATLASTRVSLAGEVARAYVEVRSLQVRIAIAQDNLASQSETLQLVQWRAQAGLVGALDVEQARSNREQTRAQVPALEASLAQSRHALALLLAESPAALDAQLAADNAALPTVRDSVALGIPADLLRRRPDIVAAERALAAATARVGVAEAARYPSFTLTGSIGLEALSVGALNQGDAVRRLLAGNLAATVFDAGRLRQQVEVQNAAQEQALASYEAAVLGALGDVENALAAVAGNRQRADALGKAVEAARLAAQLARQRYGAGLIDFSTVLDAERTVRTLEDSAASNSANRLIALVQLYKALGGGWTATDKDEDKSTG